VVRAVVVLFDSTRELAPDDGEHLVGDPHVGEVVIEDLERVAELAVEVVVLTGGATLIGMGVVAAVPDVEESRSHPRRTAADAVDDLGDFAQVVGGAAIDRRVLRAEGRTIVLVVRVQGRIALGALKGGVAGIADERLRALRAGARRGVKGGERLRLARLVRSVVVPREAEALELANGEDARRRLAEVGLDRIRDADAGNRARAVGLREVAPDPTGAAERRQPQRIARLPDQPGLLVRQTVFGIAASLDDGELSGVVELLESQQPRMEGELSTGVGIGPDQRAAQSPRGDAEAAAASETFPLVVGAQRAAAVVHRHDRIQAVVAAVEKDDDEVAVTEVGQGPADEPVAEHARAEECAGRRETGAGDELSSCDGHRILPASEDLVAR
jgi:hypothetical protein